MKLRDSVDLILAVKGKRMTAPGSPESEKTFIVQCSPDNFEQAAWLSAVFSEVLSVNEQSRRLQIFPVSDLLRGQLEKLGASVTKFQSCEA